MEVIYSLVQGIFYLGQYGLMSIVSISCEIFMEKMDNKSCDSGWFCVESRKKRIYK